MRREVLVALALAALVVAALASISPNPTTAANQAAEMNEVDFLALTD